MKTECVCKDCGKRFLGCHGKHPDGTWRCPDWGETQERREAAWQQSRQERAKAYEGKNYTGESIRRYEARRRRGH